LFEAGIMGATDGGGQGRWQLALRGIGGRPSALAPAGQSGGAVGCWSRPSGKRASIGGALPWRPAQAFPLGRSLVFGPSRNAGGGPGLGKNVIKKGLVCRGLWGVKKRAARSNVKPRAVVRGMPGSRQGAPGGPWAIGAIRPPTTRGGAKASGQFGHRHHRGPPGLVGPGGREKTWSAGGRLRAGIFFVSRGGPANDENWLDWTGAPRMGGGGLGSSVMGLRRVAWGSTTRPVGELGTAGGPATRGGQSE